MDNSTSEKIYSAVGTALFMFAINLFWLERTGSAMVDTIRPHAQRPSSILIGEFAIVLVSFFILFVFDRHWRRSAAESWILRLPVAWMEPNNPRDSLVNGIRIIGFIAFVIVPAWVAVHLLAYLGDQAIVDRQGVINGLEFWTPTWAFMEAGTYGGDNRFRFENRDGVSFFPYIEAVFLGILVAAQCLWTMYILFRMFVSYQRKI